MKVASHWLSVAISHWLGRCWAKRKSFFLFLACVEQASSGWGIQGILLPAEVTEWQSGGA